jgi:hypothetical protein
MSVVFQTTFDKVLSCQHHLQLSNVMPKKFARWTQDFKSKSISQVQKMFNYGTK